MSFAGTDTAETLRHIFTPQVGNSKGDDGWTLQVTSLGVKEAEDRNYRDINRIESQPANPHNDWRDVKAAIQTVVRAAKKQGPSSTISYWTRHHPIFDKDSLAGFFAVYEARWFRGDAPESVSEDASSYGTPADSVFDVEEDEEDEAYTNIVFFNGLRRASDCDETWRTVNLPISTGGDQTRQTREMSQVVTRVTELLNPDSGVSPEEIKNMTFAVSRPEGEWATYKWQ